MRVDVAGAELLGVRHPRLVAVEGAAVVVIGVCTVCPAARSLSAKVTTPGVSPSEWWSKRTSAIGRSSFRLHLGTGTVPPATSAGWAVYRVFGCAAEAGRLPDARGAEGGPHIRPRPPRCSTSLREPAALGR